MKTFHQSGNRRLSNLAPGICRTYKTPMDFSGVDQALDGILKFTKVPSLSYGIIHQGKILKSGSKGFRDVEAGLPADEDTLYAIGSLSKAFTAVLCGIIVSEGVLSWSELSRQY